jgi:hypothetical protein
MDYKVLNSCSINLPHLPYINTLNTLYFDRVLYSSLFCVQISTSLLSSGL